MSGPACHTTCSSAGMSLPTWQGTVFPRHGLGAQREDRIELRDMITERDKRAISLAYELHYLTIGQASSCVYGTRNVAQRRLAAIEREGSFISFPASHGRRGHPTKVHYLNIRRRQAIQEHLQSDLDTANIPRRPPENLLTVLHTIGLNDLLTSFVVASRARGVTFQFIPEYWKAPPSTRLAHPCTDRVRDPMNPHRMVQFRRDAICCLGTAKGKALFEIEYDRGKESITSAGVRQVTVARKILVFLESLRSKRFERYADPMFFGHPFRVSRLLLVTTSEKRLRNIASLCTDIGTHDLVYLSVREWLDESSILGRVWIVPEEGGPVRKPLVSDT